MSEKMDLSVVLRGLDCLLSPLGFKKRGMIFRRIGDDVTCYVQVIKLRSQYEKSREFTVQFNVAINKLRPYDPDPTTPEKVEFHHAHFPCRLEWLRPVRGDPWIVDESSDMASVAKEVVDQARQYGLPVFEKYGSVETLRKIWSEGKAPGITDKLAKRYLDLLTSLEEKEKAT